MGYTDKQVEQEARAFVEEHFEEVAADIARLVSQRSVEEPDKAADGAPWGPGPRAALDIALELMAREGLEVTDGEGYLGWGDLPGTSGKTVAMISHVDVVPEGPGWDSEPYVMDRREGYLVGRGVIDDKGPWVVALWATKFMAMLAERQGAPLAHTIRLIAGCNEETGMGDVHWYLEHQAEPDFLFTPDGSWPVIYAEKGGFKAEFVSAPLGEENRVIVELAGGHVTNAIPFEAHAIVRADASALPAADRVTVTDLGDGTCRIEGHGKGGHASLPEGSVNAIGLVTDYLLANGLCNDAERAYLELEHDVMGSTDASTLGFASTDDVFGPTTCIGGTVRTTDDGHFVQTIDSRYVTTVTGEQIEAAVREVASRHGATVEGVRVTVPSVGDKDSAAVRALVDTYNELTDHQDEPLAIGGGTYARHFAHGVAFGPEDPYETFPAWCGAMHGPNEVVSERTLKDAFVIYCVALWRLMQVEL